MAVLVSPRNAKTGARKSSRPAGGGKGGIEGVRGPRVGRERVSEIQYARILGAMTEVACERGAAHVTVAHVVARSGVSRRTFYELFDDREACFLAAFDDALQRIAARVVPAYQGEQRPNSRTDWRERIRGGLAELLGLLDEEPQVGRLCIAESLSGGPKALERRAHVIELVRHALEGGGTQTRGEPPPLAAEGVIGAVSSVLHTRLIQPSDTKTNGHGEPASFTELLGPLMGMIVLPYQGAAAAAREIERPPPPRSARPRAAGDPLRELDMRLTYRTVRVLLAIAQTRGASNREIAEAAGVEDQGQISKLLSRLKTLGLIENTGGGPLSGEPNAWHLTPKGQQVADAIQTQTSA